MQNTNRHLWRRIWLCGRGEIVLIPMRRKVGPGKHSQSSDRAAISVVQRDSRPGQKHGRRVASSRRAACVRNRRRSRRPGALL